ncbi:MAG TPA: hypothetical protein VFA56_01630 [Gaiellaceae bacterium]|nr:hypothetical protein [Gaiellaceae bacterium]
MQRFAVIAAVVAAAFAVTGTASAAQLIARNATGVSIKTNAKGEALFVYRENGRLRHVLVWGAVNARTPAPGARQVEFKVDYSGGWRARGTTRFTGTCGRYDGPALPYVVAACKAPDGSYWAAQSWGRPLPNLGFTPWTSELRQKWLEVSHWTGELAKFETGSNWVYGGRFQSIFGRLTYHGAPVYGFGTTRYGAPTDGFGRLIYLDTYNSSYGPGWKRENSFVPHNPTGVFCYGFYPFDPTRGGYRHPPGATAKRGPGTGVQYRLTASGPGVTPNVTVVVPGGHPFNPSSAQDVALQQQQTQLLLSWGDKSCRAGL